jgi:membrane protein implicated in regulation of membrane protease activity
MRSVWMFLLVVLIAIACAGIGIYYLIPGIYHILIISETGNPTAYHLKHALLFFVLAILSLVALRYVQPRPAEKIKTRPLEEQKKQR